MLGAWYASDVPRLKIDDLYKELGLPVEPRPHNALHGAMYAWKALEMMMDRIVF
jgi:hypothetical protein